MIASLQSLRFIFALMIFFHHLDGMFEAGGTCGVSFFLILSGFVMSLGYYEKVQQKDFSYKKFIYKRLIRLYPLHLLCMVLAVVLHINHLSITYFIKLIPGMFLVQSWIPIKGIYFAGNALSWCLADMIFFYLLFPYIVRFIQKISKKLLQTVAFGAIVLYLFVLIALPEDYAHAILYINPLFRLYDFVIGIGLYKLYQYVANREWGLEYGFYKKTIIELGVILLLLSVILVYPQLDIKVVYASAYWIPMALLITVFAQFNNQGGVISVILTNRFLCYMGSISFSFYMIHQLCFKVFTVFERAFAIDISIIAKIPLYLMLVSLAAILLDKYYEKPISRYLNKYIF